MVFVLRSVNWREDMVMPLVKRRKRPALLGLAAFFSFGRRDGYGQGYRDDPGGFEATIVLGITLSA